MISIIVAIGKNNELGKKNALLWNLPADMKHFKETTSGHPVIMGRKTFESIGRPLPNRQNIVITRNKTHIRHGVYVTHSLEEAINLFKNSNEEIFIIGGAEIYKQAMEFADKLYITQIEAENKNADAFFPEINLNKWQKIKSEKYPKDNLNKYDLEFVEYIRKVL